MKIVINRCYGGFSLSFAALQWLYLQGYDADEFKHDPEEFSNRSNKVSSLMRSRWSTELKEKFDQYMADPKRKLSDEFNLECFSPEGRYILTGRKFYEHRDNPLLVKCVEALGEKASGPLAALEVIEIPDGVEWYISEGGGVEEIHERHRIWP